MSTAVQITLIICGTIIISQVISTFCKKEEKLTQIVYSKYDTPKPPKTGSGIK